MFMCLLMVLVLITHFDLVFVFILQGEKKWKSHTLYQTAAGPARSSRSKGDSLQLSDTAGSNVMTESVINSYYKAFQAGWERL